MVSGNRNIACSNEINDNICEARSDLLQNCDVQNFLSEFRAFVLKKRCAETNDVRWVICENRNLAHPALLQWCWKGIYKYAGNSAGPYRNLK